MTNSLQRRKGRYVQGGETKLSEAGRLDWWERRLFERDSTDLTVTISPRYHLRPDLMAYDYYGDSSLMWIILQYSTITDVAEEFVSGKIIRIPSSTRVHTNILNSSVTGVSF